MHDPSLERVTHRLHRGDVAKLKYEELPFLRNDNGDEEPIVLLETIFKEFPNKPINLDVKNRNPLLRELVHLLIKKYNRQKITVWGSFILEVQTALYKMGIIIKLNQSFFISNSDPTIPQFCSAKSAFKILALYWLGLLPFVPINESCWEFLWVSRDFIPAPHGKGWNFLMVVLNFLFWSPNFVKHLQGRFAFTKK
jgi:hypothetical protein